MSNKIIKKAAACGLSAVMAFGLVAVTEAPKTTNVSAATKKVKKLSLGIPVINCPMVAGERVCDQCTRTLDECKDTPEILTKKC